MGFRISNIHDYDKFLAIDLWSYRIRAALYVIEDSKLTLEGHASVRQQKKNIQDGVIVDMQWVAHAIEKAIHEASRYHDEIPRDIILTFSPVVAISDAISSQYIREYPDEPITMDELDMMIEKIEKASLSRAKQKAKREYAIIHDDIRLISSTLTSIAVDGEDVSHPLWVTWKHVKISVLNIYSLASEYNILRSIVSSLKKNIISIVPTALVLPKLLEKTEHAHENNLYIDIGYTHMTLVSEERNEIQYFETFSTGSQMLSDIFAEDSPKLSYTEIESLIMRAHPTPIDREGREEVMRQYFAYILDTLLSVIARHEDSLRYKNFFLSWGIFDSPWIADIFFSMLEEITGTNRDKYFLLANHCPGLTLPSSFLLATALSDLAQELLHTKKDPIIRILRYTLYHYE
jgi:cell division ATPase FtsA